MRFYKILKGLVIFAFFFATQLAISQTIIRGEVIDGTLAEPLIGASVIIKGTLEGTTSDYDGKYIIQTDLPLPIIIEISYIGFETIEIEVANTQKRLSTVLSESSFIIDAIEVRGSRILDKQKESPLTVESLDIIGIKETPSSNFYDGLGAMKDVDLTAASLGFKIINTRGFNSTSPVRSLQIIDGVDNQAPGLNFSLGNFLGSSELDVLKVNIVVGASSAYYGPNAFNGVINMETKNPFVHKGTSFMVKAGERNLLEGAFRYADVFQNKNGKDVFAFKLNLFAFKARDWEAENYSPITDSNVAVDNPGGFDAVNTYGDEYFTLNDVTGSLSNYWTDPGIGTFYRAGYNEIDLVDYDTRNYKGNLTFHLRTKPEQDINSPELIFSSSVGSGTTVYQGDNRFSLRNILFFQNRLEFRKRNKFFIRAYATNEDAGDSYDPYFTALRLQERSKNNENWALDYRKYWKAIQNYPRTMREEGYPTIEYDPVLMQFLPFDFAAADQWLLDNNQTLTSWHQAAAAYANLKDVRPEDEINDFYQPGTQRFQTEFDNITSTPNNEEGGTMFIDKSALYHIHGEYNFTPSFFDEVRAGANYRLYAPRSEGTIFYDTAGIKIRNSEFGFYGGVQKKLLDNRLTASATLRVDKNENLPWIQTPAASLVYKTLNNTYLRVSFSSALRNPTLSDQYLNLNVGRATLAGNINGADSLITIESFEEYTRTLDFDDLVFFDIDPVKPEKVQTWEAGLRTTLFNSLFLDMGIYFNTYNDFLGYEIGIDADIDFNDPLSYPQNLTVYRYSANSKTKVKTQGFSIGLNYYLGGGFALSGNYSYNKLTKVDKDDRIIPAYNTPENKFNLGFSGRDMNLKLGDLDFKNFGFNMNYKWVEGFSFEGSPQFTGLVPSYDLLDIQVNYTMPALHTTLKVGASNILNNEHFETYGGPFIGRLGYISLLYDFKKK